MSSSHINTPNDHYRMEGETCITPSNGKNPMNGKPPTYVDKIGHICKNQEKCKRSVGIYVNMCFFTFVLKNCYICGNLFTLVVGFDICDQIFHIHIWGRFYICGNFYI